MVKNKNMSEVDLENKIRLNQARRGAVRDRANKADGILPDMSSAKKFAKIATPLGAIKAAKNMVTAPANFQITDIFIYGVAMMLAFFKDLLDLAIGLIPGVVTIIGFFISMAIGALLLFDGVSGAKRKIARNLTKKFLVLIAGTIVESLLIGLNYFPFEMITVAIIYWMTLMGRKK